MARPGLCSGRGHPGKIKLLLLDCRALRARNDDNNETIYPLRYLLSHRQSIVYYKIHLLNL